MLIIAIAYYEIGTSHSPTVCWYIILYLAHFNTLYDIKAYLVIKLSLMNLYNIDDSVAHISILRPRAVKKNINLSHCSSLKLIIIDYL